MKRNFLVIGGVVVIVLVIAGVFGWQRLTASAAATTVRAQTATVTRGSLVATVNAAGNVSVPEEATMAFQSSGRVAKVAVQVGDKVKKDQLLMQLDTADLQLTLKTQQANLASAQANYDASQANLQFALRTAQANLASAKANLDSAKGKNATNLDQLIVAKAALDKATVALQTAQGNYNAVAWRADVGMTQQAATLQTATTDYNSAMANYRITAAGINDTAVRTAQASVDNAQVSLDQAQKNLDTTARTSQASLDNAKVAVEQAQRNLDKASLSAPFDGQVAAVNFSPGDSAGTGTAVTIVDLSNLQVKMTIAEVDMAKIQVGQTAQMAVDALPGKTYNAKVIAISPVGMVTQGVVNYTVTVALTNADASIRPGMTANLGVVVDRRENVLLIPTRAVRTQGNQKIVTVSFKGQSIQTPVGTGLSNETMIEITNGLNEGDEVLLNQTSTQQRNAGAPVPAGPGGVMFMGR
ncbi:MAG: efflux RND transporter periplasmic adaptor subunit [Chloroflexi bacterium]|nr:efflux RND transporter periplasmic adaptor subunit [Chloroflexota bacterium]